MKHVPCTEHTNTGCVSESGDVIFGKQDFRFQCVKWVKFKLKKSKLFYMYFVFICVTSK
jgi:hypothetical protein